MNALLHAHPAVRERPAKAVEALDQASWTSLKRTVRLPSGVSLAYVELGDPQGEPLLLLHGFTDSSRSWSLMAPYLARYRLLIPDQRGHGGSDAPEGCYGSSQFADDARLFLDALGIERAVVAGHSLGSMAGVTLAAYHPERVGGLVLIASTALVPVRHGDWLYDEVAALEEPLDASADFIRATHPANQPTPVDPVFAEAVRQEFMTIPVRVWKAVMRELAYVPVGRHAADIKAPVLVITGGKDPLFPAEHHESLLAAFPHARARVFPELGHNLLWEEPAAIAAEMLCFVAGTN
jgi:pimeloyl-ACP methyl ester carboxylesterase